MAIVQVSRRESGLDCHSRKRGKAQAIVGPIRAAWRYIWISGASKKMRCVEHKQIELIV
jgi:hypothetical protein